MNISQYRIYKDDILKLTRSIEIKSSLMAEAVNAMVSSEGYVVDNDDPTSWKYYKHLAGEYHESDELITILSLDTLEEITFSAINLKEHKTTSRQYHLESTYIKNLIEKFPSQETLIRGIVNPVKMSKITAARENEILTWDTSLVEENEYNLIPHVQHFIDTFALEWNVDDYRHLDDNYVRAKFGILWSYIPRVIEAKRLDNTRTKYAHPFHVWAKLSSFYRVDDFKAFIREDQALWLYRNIDYVINNLGKDSTFRLLADKFFTDAGMWLYHYRMKHNIEDLPIGGAHLTEYHRDLINTEMQGFNTLVLNNQSMAGKAYDHASGNPFPGTEDIDLIDKRTNNSRHDELPTKVYEVEAMDYTDTMPITLDECLLSHWIYYSSIGIEVYDPFCYVENSWENVNHRLTAREAFVLYLYVQNKVNGVELEYIPEYINAQGVNYINQPSVLELSRLATEDGATDRDIEYFTSRATEPTIIRYQGDFYDWCQSIRYGQLERFYHYTGADRYDRHGQLELFYNIAIGPVKCKVFENSTTRYSDWLEEKEIYLDKLQVQDWGDFMVTIWDAVTGAGLHKGDSLIDVQKAMIGLVKRLSSYNIQILSNVISPKHKDGRNSPLRWGKQTYQVDGNPGPFEVTATGRRIYDLKVSNSINTIVDFSNLELDRVSYSARTKLPMKKLGSATYSAGMTTQVRMPRLSITQRN